MFRRLALTSITQPLSRPVPGESGADYLHEIGAGKAARRAASRRLAFWLSGQERFRLDRIPAGARRVLWIYFGEDQIGDALMDLASRSLLVDAGLQVDLVAAPVVAALFEGDPWFGKVGSDTAGFSGSHYDCAIVLSNKRRPLQQKIRHFPRLPWVSLHGYFTGPNFHRGAFGAQRLADLLGLTPGAAQLQAHARQKLGPIPPAATDPAADLQDAVGLVMGGVRSDRVYQHWDQVVRQLVDAGHSRFVLVGSANGAAQAATLIAGAPAGARIADYTGRLSLAGTRALLDATPVVACPDGGLMHLALTVRAALVPLFSAQIAPQWRLPADVLPDALQAGAGGVSNIPSQQVSRAIARLLAQRKRGWP
ncbi:glycosyltransferase family 9 protein [Caenimonas terrae]|uniref:Glycosyltransferase family 9 protein n=1 Tax=Caenimonas terrae TaxID=696074 RepID=A0ABW0NGN0_9BURK